MSGLAKFLLKGGAIVTGSDSEDSPTVQDLRGCGADIKIGQCAENIDTPIETVVISAAIKEDNPELTAAIAAGGQVCKYAELLGSIMDRMSGIAICGTHGKSTTSAWLTFVMDRTGLSPSFIVGAPVPQLNSSSGAGNGEHFIAEACEYDRSFLNLHPKMQVFLNIEQDHLDYYKDEDDIVDAFCEFSDNLSGDGIIIANADDENVQKVLQRAGGGKKIITFGMTKDCHYYADNIRLVDGLYEFDVCSGGKNLGRTKISLPGEHNILNSLAAVAAAINAGAPAEQVIGILGQFSGIERRLMLKGKFSEITVLDDYAHHPTEIRASLVAIRQRYGHSRGRIWCVFQPHQYSRTRFFLDDFAESFKLADITIVPQIYFVRDTADSKKEINAKVLVDKICGLGSHAFFIDDFGAICEYLKTNVRAGDMVVTMGAGDIWKVADEYIQWLGRDS